MGDKALKYCVQVIHSLLRPNDLLGRLGGEEFAIFMSDIDPDTAFQYAENIRLNISKMPIPLNDRQQFYIQVSIGICLCTPKINNLLMHYLNRLTMRCIKPNIKGETKL